MSQPSATQRNQPFDAVTLEILWRRTISAVDEAAKALRLNSFSTLVNESNRSEDCFDALALDNVEQCERGAGRAFCAAFQL